MQAIVAFLFLIVSVPAVISTPHTTCFNYFLQKDGCVFASANSQNRCPASLKRHPAPVQPFTLQTASSSKHKRAEVEPLVRRYDTNKPSFPIGSGEGNCGYYNSSQVLGVCLWSGAEQVNPTTETAGWLNSFKTSNCGKSIYIQRVGLPDTVQYARVIDGCSFNTESLEVGCFEIGLTVALFDRFNPSPKERNDQLLYGGITWDFNNLDGRNPQSGPV